MKYGSFLNFSVVGGWCMDKGKTDIKRTLKCLDSNHPSVERLGETSVKKFTIWQILKNRFFFNLCFLLSQVLNFETGMIKGPNSVCSWNQILKKESSKLCKETCNYISFRWLSPETRAGATPT